MKGQHTETISDSTIPFSCILQEILPGKYLQSVEQFCDDGEGELVRYNVYKLGVDDRFFVLKKADDNEIYIYERFLEGRGLPTPRYFGNICWNSEQWILIEFVPGMDLRDFTEEMAHACAESIAVIMNEFWQETKEEFREKKQDDRFDRYWKRINKRALCLEKEPVLKNAYQLFLQRQLTCPRTLCNGDFLQYNAIYRDGRAMLIDWAFAGIMPYSLDIARLIAHGTEDRITFPFYMNDKYREIYVREVYERLKRKPDWDQYVMDIKLSLLNEYVEFIEGELDDPSWTLDPGTVYYYEAALKLAGELIEGKA